MGEAKHRIASLVRFLTVLFGIVIMSLVILLDKIGGTLKYLVTDG